MIEKAELTDNAMNQIVEVVKPILEKKDKEIERLNNDIKVLLEENENKEKVIKAQDNIINEFEEWLNNIPNYFMDRRSNNTGVYVQKGMQQMIDMCNNKLQELKGRIKSERIF